MGATSIEWTDRVWNPVRGCALVSDGCRNCYAMKQAHRFSGPGGAYEGLTEIGPQGPRWTGSARFVPEMLGEPLRWRKPARVFVNSMSDLFHEDVTDEQIAAVFGVMAAAPQHTFQVLTKRAERMARWFDWRCETAKRLSFPAWPLPNVWIGVSVENQKTADERIPHLLRVPAAVRFLSVEPMIGAVEMGPYLVDDLYRLGRAPRMEIDWVIVGGESGPRARPFDLAWARSIVAQCRQAGVPVFVKQLGARPLARDVYDLGHEAFRAWDAEHAGEPFPPEGVAARLRDRKGGDPAEWPEDLRVREFPRGGHDGR